MKFFFALMLMTGASFASDFAAYDKLSFKPTKNGFEIHLTYQEVLGTKAFLDVPTNVDFKTHIECENLGGYTFAHITLERDYLFINPEKSRFKGGNLTTSHTSIRLKTHKLCNGELVDVVTVDGKKVPKFGFKTQQIRF